MKTIKEEALVLRTCNADMTSHGGFKWPENGPVAAPDWKANGSCGEGLHGFLWGVGDGELACWDADAKWLVAEIEEYIDLGGKVKFPSANVLFCGDRKGATEFIMRGRNLAGVVGAWVSAGDRGTATAGNWGTATAGDRGVLILLWWDAEAERHRRAVGLVGENGIKPNTPYRCDDGQFVEVV